MFVWNYIICTGLAIVFKGNLKFEADQNGLLFAVILGAVTGILYLVNFIFLQVNIRKNGVVLSATFMKLGVLVPIVMALAVFREKPKLLQIAGCILAVIAIILVQFEKEAAGHGAHKILLILLLFISGFTDSLCNVFDKLGNIRLKEEYLILTFLAAAAAAGGLKILKHQKTTVWDIFFGIIIGVPNYFSARFLLLALGSLPAVVVYPMYSVSTIVCITCAGLVLFKEKLTKQKIAALCLILAAVLCINL